MHLSWYAGSDGASSQGPADLGKAEDLAGVPSQRIVRRASFRGSASQKPSRTSGGDKAGSTTSPSDSRRESSIFGLPAESETSCQSSGSLRAARGPSSILAEGFPSLTEVAGVPPKPPRRKSAGPPKKVTLTGKVRRSRSLQGKNSSPLPDEPSGFVKS
jgi:hypothetical protein